VKINMGKPLFSSDDIKVDFKGENYLLRNLTLDDGTDIEINSLFMGTIHTVVFMDNLESADIPKLGEEICNHPVFKEKTNVNFVKVVDHETLEVKTYERGVGMTLACGTGACASVLVANMQGRCGKQADVLLKLGKLSISIAEDGNVYMEGPSVRILDGKFY
ncbi:MAG: diaminopimelate epimerase, partial [Lentihominibacter sp.]